MNIANAPALPPLSAPPSAAAAIAAGGQTDDRDADGRDLTRRSPGDASQDEAAERDGEPAAGLTEPGEATESAEAIEPAPLTSLDVRV